MTGPLLAILAAFLFGVSSPLAKLLLNDISPWLLAGLLYLGSGLGMTIVFLLRRQVSRSEIPKIKPSEFLPLLGVVVVGGILGPVFLMYGLNLTHASTASLLLNLEGVLTAGLAWVVFKEHYDRRIVVGMASIVLGGLVLSWSPDASLSSLRGPVCIAMACLCWGIDNNLTRKISLNDPIVLTLIKSLIAGSTNIALAFVVGASAIRLSYAVGAGGLGFLCYGLSLVCFILALRHLGASRTGAYFSAAPFVGAVVSILLWHDVISARFLVAAGLMAFGIYLHLSEKHEHVHTHEEIFHEHSHTHDEHHQHEHDFPVAPGERHSHPHRHERLTHRHRHFPDMHHTHQH